MGGDCDCQCPIDSCDRPFETERGARIHSGKSHSLEERFWARVDKGGPHQCWTWQGMSNPDGYGLICVDGSRERAHRVSMELHGEDPEGQWVIHYCDTPLCVNPNHLYLGDGSDNIWDTRRKGNLEQPSRRGEENGSAKLTEADVGEIRDRYESTDDTLKEIAKDFPVTYLSIVKIANGKIWSHVEVEDDETTDESWGSGVRESGSSVVTVKSAAAVTW